MNRSLLFQLLVGCLSNLMLCFVRSRMACGFATRWSFATSNEIERKVWG